MCAWEHWRETGFAQPTVRLCDRALGLNCRLQILGRQFPLALAANELVARDDLPVRSVSCRGYIYRATFTLGLNQLNDLQHLAQALVLHDRTLINGSKWS
jgi:hypothetical protein